jgi:hypothetical protein
MCHMSVIDTAFIMREDFMARGLHFISQGKRSFMRLMVNRVGNGHVPCMSSIYIICGIASPFSP